MHARITKRCSVCKEHKPLNDFCLRSRATDGLSSWCRSCTAAWHANRYRTDPAFREAKRVANRLRHRRLAEKKRAAAAAEEDARDSDEG